MMATLADLRNAVTTLLNLPAIPAVLQLNNNRRERAFEAYVFSLLARAVREAGGTATVVGINTGPNPATVVCRGSPGMLGSHLQDFAYLDCVVGENTFEVHLDVQYEGSSGATHEIDVSVYDHDAAVRLRDAPLEYAKTAKLLGAFECKFYDSRLRTVLGRTFVGLLADCGTLRFKTFASNGPSPLLATYFKPDNRPQHFFRLSPLRPSVERRFVDFFQQVFRKWSGVV